MREDKKRGEREVPSQLEVMKTPTVLYIYCPMNMSEGARLWVAEMAVAPPLMKSFVRK